MAKKKKQFKTGNPAQQLEDISNQDTKYKIGAKGKTFHEIRKMKPVFAFDYMSLNKNDFCFNSSGLTLKDFIGLLEGLKKNSGCTYDYMSRTPNYRFHSVDFDKNNISIKKSDFKKALTHKPDELLDEELPTLYQLDLHYHQKARVFGFLYIGVFYLVWFDKDHKIYSGKK